jgi:peroxiredoxin
VSEEPDGRPEGEGAPARPPHRLDPDRAAAGASRRGVRRPPPPVIDTRRYQRMIGLFGITLVIVISVSLLTTRSVGTTGIPAGRQMHLFAAPLATSTLNGDANVNHPVCTPARHDSRALNICLLLQRAPLVLGFFVTGQDACMRQVDAMQAVSREFPATEVQFAAVAVRSAHAATARAVRAHHWTIPVAYDRDGAVGDVYGVEICPIVELAYRGGVVARRLIGEHWASSAALAGQVQALLRGSAGR